MNPTSRVLTRAMSYKDRETARRSDIPRASSPPLALSVVFFVDMVTSHRLGRSGRSPRRPAPGFPYHRPHFSPQCRFLTFCSSEGSLALELPIRCSSFCLRKALVFVRVGISSSPCIITGCLTIHWLERDRHCLDGKALCGVTLQNPGTAGNQLPGRGYCALRQRPYSSNVIENWSRAPAALQNQKVALSQFKGAVGTHSHFPTMSTTFHERA